MVDLEIIILKRLVSPNPTLPFLFAPLHSSLCCPYSPYHISRYIYVYIFIYLSFIAFLLCNYFPAFWFFLIANRFPSMLCFFLLIFYFFIFCVCLSLHNKFPFTTTSKFSYSSIFLNPPTSQPAC